MMLQRRVRRSGATLVEGALIYPVVFLVTLGLVLLGIAVFRYQQVAHLAREGARWAAVHGARYSEENPTLPPGTPDNIFEYGIKPRAAGLDLKPSDVTVVWTDSNAQTSSVVVIDPMSGKPRIQTKANTVAVTVTYSWNTGLFGTIPVSSTSVMTMSY
ncbi:MAG TPA: TadE/TadG family type IV pilus assembly protein [Gemmataceae bacterium]|nr:TadE/TadG family type IV pilus assembly protein [Gemmataceae bacterium]